MPIQFPLPKRGNPFDRWMWQWGAKACPQVVRAPNLARIGTPFNVETMSPGFGSGVRVPVNVRDLRKFYQHGGSPAVVDPAGKPLTDRRVYDRVLSDAIGSLSGVTRDGDGAALGDCRVMVFKTTDNSFVTETTSDGSGNWIVIVAAPWQFYFVVSYKVGVPDVAGTSLNTLVPERA